MKCSVLICTYNRPEMLQCCLSALVDKTAEKPDEIVIVNGGDSLADQIVRSYAGRYDIIMKLVKTVNKNLAASRNIGFSYCTGDIIAMTDDDVEVAVDWVSQLKYLHKKFSDVSAIGGAVLCKKKNSFMSIISNVSLFDYHPVPCFVRFIAGANASYKRKAIQSLGLQDEALFRGEDVDFNWRIVKSGYKIYYDPDLKVYHHDRQSLKALFFQVFMYGKAYYLVREKHKDIYCIYPHSLHSIKDIAKIFYFVMRIPFDVFVRVRRVSSALYKVPAYILLVLCQIVWRCGIFYQFLKKQRARK